MAKQVAPVRNAPSTKNPFAQNPGTRTLPSPARTAPPATQMGTPVSDMGTAARMSAIKSPADASPVLGQNNPGRAAIARRLRKRPITK